MNDYIIAIELGSSKIVGIAGYRDESGTLVVAAIETMPTPNNAIQRGCVHNISEVSGAIMRIQRLLENRLSPAKISQVYVGVAGMSVTAIEQSAVNHFSNDKVVKMQDLEELKSKCIAQLPGSYDCLDVLPIGYLVDGRPLQQALGFSGTTIEGHYKAVMANPILKRNIDRCVVERAKLTIAGYIPAAISTANVVLTAEDRMLGCVLVDFGAETTTVSVYKNDNLAHLVTLPMGGQNITRDIMSLNILLKDAEMLKTTSGTAKLQKNNLTVRHTVGNNGAVSIEHTKLVSVIEARSKEIIANVVEQIKLSGVDRKDLTGGVIVVGAATKLRGWVELLEESLDMKVHMAAITKNIKVVEKEYSRISDFLQAVGLLVYASEKCTVQADEEQPVENGDNSRLVINISEPHRNYPVTPDEQDDDPKDEPDTEEDEPDDPGIKVKGNLKGFMNSIRKITNIPKKISDKIGQVVSEGEDDTEDDK